MSKHQHILHADTAHILPTAERASLAASAAEVAVIGRHATLNADNCLCGRLFEDDEDRDLHLRVVGKSAARAWSTAYDRVAGL